MTGAARQPGFAYRPGQRLVPGRSGLPDAQAAVEDRGSRRSGRPYASLRTASVRTSSRRPWAVTRARAMTAAWSKPAGISSRWWTTRTTAAGRASRASEPSAASSCARPPRSRPAKGSSSSSRSGSGSNARASWTRCCSPEERLPIVRSASSPAPKRSSSVRAAARAPSSRPRVQNGSRAPAAAVATTSSARRSSRTRPRSAALR